MIKRLTILAILVSAAGCYSPTEVKEAEDKAIHNAYIVYKSDYEYLRGYRDGMRESAQWPSKPAGGQ